MDILEDLQNHRRNIERQMCESFGYTEDIEKARVEGDIAMIEGVPKVYTQYAPGKFDWRVLNKKNIKKGVGVNGKHGIAALNLIYQNITN